jgi:hypothetical protein
MRSAHGVEIEVLGADLGERRAPQEIFVFTEERGRPVAMDLEGDFTRRCLKLNHERCGTLLRSNLQD